MVTIRMSSLSYGCDEIADIMITLNDGRQIIYKGRGIEQIRRILNRPRPSEAPTGGDKPFETEDPLWIVPRGDGDADTQRDEESARPGYNKMALNYKANDMSPMELAKKMQKQAEARGNVY